jgi:hypothetical protein
LFCIEFSGENHAGYLLCGALKRGSRCFNCSFSGRAQERLTTLYLLCGAPLPKHEKTELAEAEADAEPVGKAAGARKATADDVKWHDEEGGNIADRLPEIYHPIELVEGANPPFGPVHPSRRRNCKSSESISVPKPDGSRWLCVDY